MCNDHKYSNNIPAVWDSVDPVLTSLDEIMTTKIRIENTSDSNGDIVVQGKCISYGDLPSTLFPGESLELWITTSSSLWITETWPTKKPKNESPIPNDPD